MEITTVTPIKIFKQEGRYSRSIERLSLHLASLRAQSIKFNSIVSDMSTDEEIKSKIANICQQYGSLYVNTYSTLVWNKALCLNIGIRLCDTKFIVTCDLDILYRKDVFERCLDIARQNAIVLCQTFMYSSDVLNTDYSIESFQSLKEKGTFLPTFGNGGLQFFDREWLFKVRGYDERFNLWGGIDNEIILRAEYDHRKVVWLCEDSQNVHLVHLSHPVWEIPEWSYERVRVYRKSHNHVLFKQYKLLRPIIANPNSWGQEVNVMGPRYEN